MSNSLFTLIVVISLSFSQIATAQTHNGDLRLETQEQVDNFNYTEVRGKLSITGSSITNLSGMSGLERVTHNFNILDCNALLNLNGIETLEHVGWQINVWRNQILNDVTGLNGVNYVGGHIDLSSNPSLEEIAGFESMITASNEAYLQLINSSGLKRITAFQNMKDIMAISIDGCDSLMSITGFSNLEKVNYTLVLWNCALLTDISGLSNITEVGTKIMIAHNDSLKLDDFQTFCSLFNGATPPTSVFIQGNADNPTAEEIVAACNTTHVVSEITKQSLSVYPNPAQNRIKINCPQFIEAKIYSPVGTLLFMSDNAEINLQNLQSGLYIVEVKTGQGNFQTKFIKQ